VDEIGTNAEEPNEEYQAHLTKQRLDDSFRRRFLYNDVESLLTDGFLHAPAYLKGCVITFRTLPLDRLTSLRARCDSVSLKGDVMRWVLASSVWMVDGYDVFEDRNAPFHLRNEFFKDLRLEHLNAMFDIYNALQNRLDRAMTLSESYCYESYSRALWRLQGRKAVQTDDNNVRRMWVAHNIAEDEYLDDLRRWEHTRAQVGSVSGKGAQHLSRELERMKSREEDRRQKQISDTLHKILYGPDWDGTVKVKITVGGEEYVVDHIQAARSFDELDEQMRRFVEGKKDAHDLVVDEYLNRIQYEMAKRKSDYEAALQAAREQEGYVSGTTGTTTMVGYTPEQLAELGFDTQGSVKSDGPSSAIASHLYDKVIGSEIRAGWISTTQMPEEYGKDSGGTTLQDKLATRKPGLENLK
jgi:hypothetical protein